MSKILCTKDYKNQNAQRHCGFDDVVLSSLYKSDMLHLVSMCEKLRL